MQGVKQGACSNSDLNPELNATINIAGSQAAFTVNANTMKPEMFFFRSHSKHRASLDISAVSL
jgi:hypothetical protein